MYRLTFTLYDTGDDRRFYALFEHEARGKTESLAKSRKIVGSSTTVRLESHAEVYEYMRGLVPLFLALLPASLEDTLPFDE